MATPAQIAANRRNAPKSTGPRTAVGKAASSRNALRHGLAARAAVVLGEDPADLARFRAKLVAALAPRDGREEFLAEVAAEAAWRLRRVWRAEAALFNRYGRSTPSCLRELLVLQRYEVAANRRFHRAIAMLEQGRTLEHVATSRNRRALSGPPNQVVCPLENRPSESSCPCLSRASTFSSAAKERVDGRDEHGHDDNGENESEKRLSDAMPRPEPDSCGVVTRRRGRIQPHGNRSERTRRNTAARRRAVRNHRFCRRNPIWGSSADTQALGVFSSLSIRSSRLAFLENLLSRGKAFKKAVK